MKPQIAVGRPTKNIDCLNALSMTRLHSISFDRKSENCLYTQRERGVAQPSQEPQAGRRSV